MSVSEYVVRTYIAVVLNMTINFIVKNLYYRRLHAYVTC